MTTPEDRAADGRPLGKVEPTTRRPQSAGGAESGRSVSGAQEENGRAFWRAAFCRAPGALFPIVLPIPFRPWS
jgi:hypothetical protein